MSTEALNGKTKIYNQLYDGESALAISSPVAAGYIVLLGGENKKKPTSDIDLAFLALTQGNVVDACFGVVTPSRREDTPATRNARKAKALIDETAGTRDSFRKIAVHAYCDAFQIVNKYHEEKAALNCVVRCFKAKSLRRKAKKSLRNAFTPVVEIIDETH